LRGGIGAYHNEERAMRRLKPELQTRWRRVAGIFSEISQPIARLHLDFRRMSRIM
jgi:hypothetical protein